MKEHSGYHRLDNNCTVQVHLYVQVNDASNSVDYQLQQRFQPFPASEEFLFGGVFSFSFTEMSFF